MYFFDFYHKWGSILLFYKVVGLFLSEAKDLANQRTNMVLLYSEASYMSRDV